jgi:hypothetical protein
MARVAKLAGLFIKTLSKPLSKRIKHDFSRSTTTQGMLIGIGQMTHSITTRLTVWSAGYKVTSIKPLESEEALKRGAEFLGESIVFLTAGGVIIWEYSSSKAKEKLKEENRHEALQKERDELQQKLHALDVRLHALEKVVKANTQSILNFGARYIEPEEVHIDISTPRRAAVTPPKAKGKVETVSSTAIVEEQTGSTNPKQRSEDETDSVSQSKRNNGWWGWIIDSFRRG